MRITCPRCAADYEVPTSRLKPGKMVRCARCGEAWVAEQEVHEFPAPETAEPAAEAARPGFEMPPLTAMDRLRASSKATQSPRTSLLTAWGIAITVLVAAFAAAFIWRADVVRVWPASGRLLGVSSHIPGATGANVPMKARQGP